jgi:ATP-dependent Clp protease ATP-binding subunit ClpA
VLSFQQIDNWLQYRDAHFYLLIGEPGVGKSAIAAHLIQTRTDIVAYHLCQAAELETLKPGRILRSPSKTQQLEAG